MILTKKFVFIHLRKTGGTFVTTVVSRVYRKRGFLARWARKVKGKDFFNLNQHGTCAEIPPSHRGLPIVSSVRNPYDRYVSMYHFKGWTRSPEQWFADLDAVRRRYPHSPDLTFEEFLEVASTGFKALDDSAVPEDRRLGCQSEEIVRYFFREPARVFPAIDDAYIAARRWEKDMHPVRWLRVEDLNRDTHALLVDSGCRPEDVAWVLEEGRILPEQSRDAPRPAEKAWQSYYTPALKETVRRRERLLFAMFPEYDV